MSLRDAFMNWLRPRPPVPPPLPPPVPPGVPGDYNKIALLDFQTDDDSYGAPPSAAAVIPHVQRYLRDGMDVPLSQWYIRVKVDLSDLKPTKENPKINRGEITARHGTSSPRLMWQALHDHGVCPLSMCKGGELSIPTPAIDAAAAPYKVGGLLGLTEVPDYTAAINHLKANKGDGLLLTTDGRESYAVVAVDDQDRGLWVGYYNSGNKANLQWLSVEEGTAKMRKLGEDQYYGKPADYFLVIKKR